MRSADKLSPAPENLEALLNENLALRRELRRRKRRVLMRRVRRGSAVMLPVARVISRKRSHSAGAQAPAQTEQPATHNGAAVAAVAALVVSRIVADARSRPAAAPSSPAGVS